MILTGFFVVCLFSYSQAEIEGNSVEEIPFVIASKDNVGGPKTSNLLPDMASSLLATVQLPSTRGRSDIEIETVEEAFGGYVYPKPSKPFNLPTFVTLDAYPGLSGFSGFNSEESTEVERVRRSPQRRPSRPRPRQPSFNIPSRPRPPSNFPRGSTFPGIGQRPISGNRPFGRGRPRNP